MKNSKKLLVLAVALLMFPQIAQTLSVYFLAFAFGVLVWGRGCDRIGRRPSMLAGLALYALASVIGLSVSTFSGLLVAQALAAFGAAVASVVTQTLLRDRFKGTELAQVFSVMGIALAVSPAIGLFTGASLVEVFGYRGVLACLLVLALTLLGWCAMSLAETRPQSVSTPSLVGTLYMMSQDAVLWRSAMLVAVFNVALFSYYSLGPFVFQHLGLGPQLFGYSGVVLALGSGLGAWLNKCLLKRGWRGEQLLALAAALALIGGLTVLMLQDSVWFVMPMLLVVLAFGMAIPNILGSALTNYGDRLGTAGALFGLMYYLMIGGGLMLVAWSQALGWTLVVCAGLAVLLTMSGWHKPRQKNCVQAQRH